MALLTRGTSSLERGGGHFSASEMLPFEGVVVLNGVYVYCIHFLGGNFLLYKSFIEMSHTFPVFLISHTHIGLPFNMLY